MGHLIIITDFDGPHIAIDDEAFLAEKPPKGWSLTDIKATDEMLPPVAPECDMPDLGYMLAEETYRRGRWLTALEITEVGRKYQTAMNNYSRTYCDF